MDAVTIPYESAIACAAALYPFAAKEDPRIALNGALLGQWPTGELVAVATDRVAAAAYGLQDATVHGSFSHPEPGIWVPRAALKWLAGYRLPTGRSRGQRRDPATHAVQLVVDTGAPLLHMHVQDAYGEKLATTRWLADTRGSTFPSLIEIEQQFRRTDDTLTDRGLTLDAATIEALGKWTRMHRKVSGGQRVQAYGRILLSHRHGGGALFQSGDLFIAVGALGLEQ